MSPSFGTYTLPAGRRVCIRSGTFINTRKTLTHAVAAGALIALSAVGYYASSGEWECEPFEGTQAGQDRFPEGFIMPQSVKKQRSLPNKYRAGSVFVWNAAGKGARGLFSYREVIQAPCPVCRSLLVSRSTALLVGHNCNHKGRKSNEKVYGSHGFPPSELIGFGGVPPRSPYVRTLTLPGINTGEKVCPLEFFYPIGNCYATKN